MFGINVHSTGRWCVASEEKDSLYWIKLSLSVLLTIQRQLSDMSDFSITWGYTLITFIIK